MDDLTSSCIAEQQSTTAVLEDEPVCRSDSQLRKVKLYFESTPI